MAGERGVKPGPQLAVVDGVALGVTRSGQSVGLIAPPPGAEMDEIQRRFWDRYIADNAKLDDRDGPMAFMWVQMQARFVRDPRSFSASDMREPDEQALPRPVGAQ